MFKGLQSKKALKALGIALIGAGTASGIGTVVSLNHELLASDHGLEPPYYPFFHKGYTTTLDHASARRGYEVYKQVCAACHSMNYTYYRQLVGKTHTEEEAKAEAAEIQVQDGPDEEGKMFMRPGKLIDGFPKPYPNKEAAQFANNGAYPPDLSQMGWARHNSNNYMFALLTGYCDPPAGMETKENVHYNPYFAGGYTSMAKALYDEVIEYTDGTPATTSQLAKDVITFITWATEKRFDERQYLTLQTLIVSAPGCFLFWIWKRRVFTVLKSRKLFWQKPKDRHSGGGEGGPKH